MRLYLPTDGRNHVNPLSSAFVGVAIIGILLFLFALINSGCSSVTVTNTRPDGSIVKFSATLPAYPWSDVNKSLDKLNLSAATNKTTLSIRGLTEETTGATNFISVIGAVAQGVAQGVMSADRKDDIR